LPGGSRYTDGSFSYLGSYGHWWVATGDGVGYAYFWYMNTGFENVYYGNNYKEIGGSVRCLQD
jgi:hypothetical protein